MKIEEYAKQFEYVVCSKADALAAGIRIGLKAAKTVYSKHEAAVPSGAFQKEIDAILSGQRDLPEAGE